MSLEFLTEYAVPVVAGICLCIGYMLKHAVPTDKINRYIPLIMGILGLIINVWLNAWTITPAIMLAGMFSGLASTGLYEAFSNIIKK